MSADPHKLLLEKRHLKLSGAGNASSKAFLLWKDFSLVDFSKIFWQAEDENLVENIVRNLSTFTGLRVCGLPLLEKDRIGFVQTIDLIQDSKPTIIVGTRESFQQLLPTMAQIKENNLEIVLGENHQLTDIFQKLVQMGYEVAKANLVEIGTYLRRGSVLDVFPPNHKNPLRFELEFNKIASIYSFDPLSNKPILKIKRAKILPMCFQREGKLTGFFNEKTLLVLDEIEDEDFSLQVLKEAVEKRKSYLLEFSPFDSVSDDALHLRYCSVLHYHDLKDFAEDIRKKKDLGWQINVLTHNFVDLKNFLEEYHFDLDTLNQNLRELPVARMLPSEKGILLINATYFKYTPEAFSNPEFKLLFVTDEEIYEEMRKRKQAQARKISVEFLMSLRPDDYVIHIDHGIGKFLGIVRKTVSEVTREYMEIAYAEEDRLFVPVDQADRVSKFIGDTEDKLPHLSRLGSAEWKTISYRVRKETQKIAKELLDLYARRSQAPGFNYHQSGRWLQEFEQAFPYEETEGQFKAIRDVYSDMEKPVPMDRLICGDVGFGKTEIAMRAAFKAVMNGKQVAFLSPITILADQHYKTFTKRMADFPIRIDVLSRFKSPKEQQETLERLKRGEIDVVIGTHRLLSDDVKFKDLGLLIIDEEQRFGVAQKEKLKKKRLEVDVLTLTATPIPRTLNMGMAGIRDITTITTPPPGRLPIVTEVRKFSFSLIREAVLRETSRGGQVYILHNEVETIEAFAQKLRSLVPEVSFVVAHGQMQANKLEERIHQFQAGEHDCLISSTIIENGIDLANANTLIVDRAENFGLAQLYQLRGRVGRSKKQAYAYFMYHTQKLQVDAKKRLKAVLEASELGSGFQIALRDLEIRGAGNILGTDQHGTINAVGVAHFSRLLNQAVEDLRIGRKTDDEEIEISIDLPLSAYIPDNYIRDGGQKIIAYQKISSALRLDDLDKYKKEIVDIYGVLPAEVENLFKLLKIKILARQAGIINIKTMTPERKEIVIMHLGPTVRPPQIINLLEYNPLWVISGDKLKIEKELLGEEWIDKLMENMEKLIINNKNERSEKDIPG